MSSIVGRSRTCFITLYIVTENSSSGAPTQAKRINDLSKKAITRGTQDLELDLLVDIVAKKFEKEIDKLREVPGLGKFDINTPVSEFNITDY